MAIFHQMTGQSRNTAGQWCEVDSTLFARWSKRTGMAAFIGALASFLYYAMSFSRVSLSYKLLGDAYHFADRCWGRRVIGTSHLMYALVLATNTLLYAAVVLVLFGCKNLLTTAREASPSDRVRRVVTFCFVQALGMGFVLFEIDPGTVVGMFLLLPGIIVAVWVGGGVLYAILATLFVNAVAWLGYFSVLELKGRFRS